MDTEDIGVLRHVKKHTLEDRSDLTVAEQIANRSPCKDFENLQTVF